MHTHIARLGERVRWGSEDVRRVVMGNVESDALSTGLYSFYTYLLAYQAPVLLGHLDH